MKSKFPGFYLPDSTFYDDLFKDAIIVLDTNILLDLYRVSPKTSEELLEIIKTLDERIWIPYQVALEYHRDLFTVVEGQIKKYNEAATAIESIRKTFLEKRSHPFLSDDLHKRATAIFEELLQFFDSQEKELENVILVDSVKDKLCKLLDAKIGNSFNVEELAKIFQEGEERYKNQTPPGYMDKNKPGNEKYGDLVVWKEIIRKSKKDSKPVLFVTDDTKDDWFIRFRGKTYGPHPQLLKEFQEATGHQIYIYTLERFLENSDKLKIQVTVTTLDELKARKEHETKDAVTGQISYYEGIQVESSNEAIAIPTIDQRSITEKLANRKGQIKITIPTESEDEVDSGYAEDKSSSNIK